MPRKKIDQLKKHTLFLREGDFDKLAQLLPEMKPSEAVRTLISRFVDKHFPSHTAEKTSTSND